MITRRNWSRQPVGGARLDLNSPFRVAWSMGSRANAIDQNGAATYGTQDAGPGHYNLSLGNVSDGKLPIIALPRIGLAADFRATGTINGFAAGIPLTWVAGSGDFTMIAVMRKDVIDSGVIASQRTAGQGWLWQDDGASVWKWYDDSNGSNNFSFGPELGVPSVGVLTCTGTAMTLYVNGKSSSITLSGARATPGGDIFQLGAHSGTSSPLDGAISMFAIGPYWTNPGLARSLIRNPWQIFRRSVYRPLFAPPGAAAAFNAAWNVSANTVISPGATLH